MAAIRIEAIPDRIGQKLYNMLHERLTPEGRIEEPKYSLRVRLHETNEELLYERDETATRANLTIRADYELRRIEDDEVIAKGSSRATSSYDILSSQYATLVSQDDARERTARGGERRHPHPRRRRLVGGSELRRRRREGGAAEFRDIPAQAGTGDHRRADLWARYRIGAGARRPDGGVHRRQPG